MCKLTVFTATYNRGHLIHRLYESLQKQSNFDFVFFVDIVSIILSPQTITSDMTITPSFLLSEIEKARKLSVSTDGKKTNILAPNE